MSHRIPHHRALVAAVALFLPIVSIFVAAPSASAAASVPVRVNANGPSFTDSGGRTWSADHAFVAGDWGYDTIYGAASTTSAVAGTTDDALYQSYNLFNNLAGYKFDVANGTYQVTLKMVEDWATAAGQRKFDVRIEGTTVLSAFDIFASCGAFTACDRTFSTSVGDGQLNVQFTMNGGANYATVSAIEVTGSGGGGGDTTPPSAPGNLHVTGTTSSSVSLAWNASTDNVGVSGYDVFRGSTKVATVTATSFTDSGLAASTTFTYTVKARDAAGNTSTASNQVSATTQSAGGDTTAPSVPANLRVTGASSSSISLAWNASTDNVGVSGYEVRRDGGTIFTSSTTSFTDTGLSANTTHSYVVRAFDAAGNRSAFSGSVSGTTTSGGGTAGMNAAPYYFPGFGTPLPVPSTVISATGIKWFTIAFVLASGCNAVWDGESGLTGGQHQTSINAIRAAGGDIIPSFGGFNGSKLGEACATPADLAAQYLRVVDQFNLQAIDIDIEANEFDNDSSRNRVVDALKLVKQQRPTLKVIVTIPILITGPNFAGTQLINRAASSQANIDIFTIMPFDFGGGNNMFNSTVSATNGTRDALKTAFGWSDATAFAHLGISGMNGLSDQSELTTPDTWTQIRDFAAANHLARLAFWGVNRDRGCPGQPVNSSCSSISQTDWQFTAITAGFRP
jgi:chitodextrinase